jgi:tripartite-type tricarboxylate transporter receptor subunit TctC
MIVQKFIRKHRNIVVCTLLVFFLAGLLSGCGKPEESAEADAFPERPLKVLLGYAPGGGVDVSFRLFQPYLEKELGQPIEIVYRAGASGQIAWTGIADAEPDGYTFGITASPLMEFSVLTQKPSYDINSFAYLGTYTF